MHRSPSQITAATLAQNAQLRRLTRGQRPKHSIGGVSSVMHASQLMT
jgi:hypothetical protein